MDAVRFLQVVFMASLVILRSLVHCKEKVNCQKFRFAIDEDVIHNHALQGHVFRRTTVASAAQCHVNCKEDCLCVSMNYFATAKENNCELNSANKEVEPAAMKSKPGVDYYDIRRSYSVKVSRNKELKCWVSACVTCLNSVSLSVIVISK